MGLSVPSLTLQPIPIVAVWAGATDALLQAKTSVRSQKEGSAVCMVPPPKL